MDLDDDDSDEEEDIITKAPPKKTPTQTAARRAPSSGKTLRKTQYVMTFSWFWPFYPPDRTCRAASQPARC